MAQPLGLVGIEAVVLSGCEAESEDQQHWRERGYEGRRIRRHFGYIPLA